jgi:hypothetical protein
MRWSIGAAMVFVAASAFAAPRTWTGEITSSACVGEHMASFHGKTDSPRECAEDCMKGGAKFVFVSQGKVYEIANQQNPALKTYLGRPVRLSGDLKGSTIAVSKVESMPGKARAGKG